ncbi:unnamed protein product [Toxocara canis]|uniref:Secreted protein n=1 Tax=Toxocara canis TaxID=6265 RepID=A0A183TVF8_TOXCA|nr:unnamed protein product [Toxocara canis]
MTKRAGRCRGIIYGVNVRFKNSGRIGGSGCAVWCNVGESGVALGMRCLCVCVSKVGVLFGACSLLIRYVCSALRAQDPPQEEARERRCIDRQCVVVCNRHAVLLLFSTHSYNFNYYIATLHIAPHGH